MKPDAGCTAAELVFGTPLRLTAEFFDIVDVTLPPLSSQYIVDLRRPFRRIRPTPPHLPQTSRVLVSQDLLTCIHTFIHRGAVKDFLIPPYDGPFQVLARTLKHFTLLVNDRQDVIAVDRVKPANLYDPPEKRSLAATPSRDLPTHKHVSWTPLPSANSVIAGGSPVAATSYGGLTTMRPSMLVWCTCLMRSQ